MSKNSRAFCCAPGASALERGAGATRTSGLAHARLLECDPPAPLQRLLVLVDDTQAAQHEWALCEPVQPLPAGGVAAMRTHVPYAVVDACADWRRGHVALVMTVRNDDIPPAAFLGHLKEHVQLVQQLFEPRGLDGYYVYAGEEFEWAWLHWPSREAASAAFATPEGARGPQHSRSFQHVLCAATDLLAAAGRETRT